jgi:hypothetical protein
MGPKAEIDKVKKDKKKKEKKQKRKVDEPQILEEGMDDGLENEAKVANGPLLTQEDALALAEAIVEMVNDGATHPIGFFVSPKDALGRELIRLQGGEEEDMQGLVPVVLDAAHVHRYAMLTVADAFLWKRENDVS